MRSEAYVREYLAPLSKVAESGSGDSETPPGQGTLRAICYAADTPAGISREELLLVLGEVLELDSERRMSVESLRAALAEPLHRAESLERELAAARHELEQTRQQLELIQTSRSWRLTGPLRRWVTRLRRTGGRPRKG